MFSSLFSIKKRYLLLLICLFDFLLIFLFDSFVLTDEVYYRSYEERLTVERIEKILAVREQWFWLKYALSPVGLGLKLGLISLIIMIGITLQRWEVSFGQVFKIVLLADFVFFIPSFFNWFWLVSFESDITLKTINQLDFFSLKALFEPDSLEMWLAYPLQVFNLFEVLYWFFLAYSLSFISQKSYNDSLGMILSTYLLGLLLWVVTNMFLFVMLSK